jgi:hypothetical protein
MSDILECPNCGSPLVGRYCSGCGQAAPSAEDYSFRAHVGDFFEHLISLDGKVARTLLTLVRSPGLLTIDHLAGRRARYVRPLQLFLLVNVLLFFAGPRIPLFSYSLANYSTSAPPSPTLVRSLIAAAVPAGDSAARAEYARAFDDRVEAERKSLILLFVPALALVLRVIFWRRGREAPIEAVSNTPRQYGEHLVFAFHVLAFAWLMLIGWGTIATILTGRVVGGVLAGALGVLVAASMLVIPAYFFRASRLVYLLSLMRAIALTAVVGIAFLGLILAYRSLLFFTTYYTL